MTATEFTLATLLGVAAGVAAWLLERKWIRAAHVEGYGAGWRARGAMSVLTIDENQSLRAINAELLSAIEWRDEVIANLEEVEDEIEVDVECGCERCRREAWLVN